MIAILRKDLRLSLDALLPWVMVVAAVFVFGAASARLRGIFSAFPSQTVLVEEFASLLVLSVGAMTAWITAVVLHGDRRHRASSLAAVLPISRSQRHATQLLSILLASTLPVGICVAAQLLRWSSTGVAPLIEPGRTWWLPIAMGTAGIGWAWFAARWSRKIFEVVGLSVLGGALSIGAGLGGAWAYDTLAVAPRADVPGATHIRYQLMTEALTSLPALALLCGGIAAFVAARLLGRVRRRSVTAWLTVALALVILAAPAFVGAAAIRTTVLGSSVAAQLFRTHEQIQRIQRLPETTVVNYLRAWNVGSNEWLALGDDGDRVGVWEIWQAFSLSESRPEQVNDAFANLNRVDSAANAAFTVQARATCRRRMAGDVPEVELDALRRYPRDVSARAFARMVLIQQLSQGDDANASALHAWTVAAGQHERAEAGALIRLLEHVRDRQAPSSRFGHAASEAALALRNAWRFEGDNDLPALPPGLGAGEADEGASR